MLQAQNLKCERDYRILFDNLSFSLLSGEALRIVGSNGSGKTTLLRILCGLYHDYSGKVVWSNDLAPFHFLYQGHAPGVKDNLTAEENLAYLMRLVTDEPVQLSRLKEGLQAVGLAGFEDVLCGSLSAGQRKRVNLARFSLSEHPLWVMDEPFSAIDSQGVDVLQEMMDAHIQRGGALIVTSHQDMNLAESVKEVALGS